jgi:hypothetical protein
MQTLSLLVGTPAGNQLFGLDQLPLTAFAQDLVHLGVVTAVTVKV